MLSNTDDGNVAVGEELYGSTQRESAVRVRVRISTSIQYRDRTEANDLPIETLLGEATAYLRGKAGSNADQG